MKTIAPLLMVAISLSFGSLPAQVDQSTLIGRRVRVTMPPTTERTDWSSIGRPAVMTGELIAMTDSTISLRRDANGVEVTLPRSYVRRFEVSTGMSRGASGKLGGRIGALVGAAIGFAGGEDCKPEDIVCFSRPATAFGGAALGSALGFAIGFAVGGVEGWCRSELPARAAVIPTGTGSVMLTATFTF